MYVPAHSDRLTGNPEHDALLRRWRAWCDMTAEQRKAEHAEMLRSLGIRPKS